MIRLKGVFYLETVYGDLRGMDLSIVIPAYNESEKIRRDIESAASFFANGRLAGQVIVVDDGSTDGTGDIAEDTDIGHKIDLRVVRLGRNRGKGAAIRAGMEVADGEYVMFADSGTCIPFSDVLRGLDILNNYGCDIAHGSRVLKESIIEKQRNWYRRICSSLFRLVVFRWLSIPAELTDTQCGFKMYRGDVGRRLYAECVTDGYMFDVEIILRAVKYGYRIGEFAVEWSCDPDSRLDPARNATHILAELAKIKQMLAKE